MRVLHVIPSIGPKRGGPSAMIRIMTEGLTQLGAEVHIATTDDNGARQHLSVPIGEPVVENGVTVHYFPKQTEFYQFSWSLTRWLAKNTHEYDVVHIHALFSYAPIPAAFYAHRAKIPYIVRPLGVLNRYGMQMRRPFLKKLSFRLIDRRILRHAARVHYTCEGEREQAQALGVASSSVVIPLGIDLEPFSAEADTDWLAKNAPHLAGRTIILFLARIDPKKGLDLLLPAFAGLLEQQPQTGLVIAGTGSEDHTRQMQALTRQLDIENDVYWAGFLQGNEKIAAYRAASLFVLPSYSENFGIVVVEAMASGLPVVITDQVGIHQEVKEGQAGWVVSCTIDGVEDALKEAIENSRHRELSANNGVKLSNKQFSQQVMVNRLYELYQNIINH